MNKFNFKNEILTASKMQSIKGGDELPVKTPIVTTVSGSDPRPKLPSGVIIRGGAYPQYPISEGNFVQGGYTQAGDCYDDNGWM